MGSVNSVPEAKSHEDPSTNQRDVDESSKTLFKDQEGSEESSKTLIKDLKGGEESSKNLTQDQGLGEESRTLIIDQERGEESSKTLTQDQGHGEESKTLTGDQEQDSSKTLIKDLNETKAEEEDEQECGLCRYIKKGDCKEAFIALEKCVDEAVKNEKDSDVMKCKEVRVKFKTCMYENPVYYEPIIAGEATAIAKMYLRMLEVEKEAILAGDVSTIARAVSRLHSENAEPVMPAQAAVIAKAFQELEAKKDKDKAEEEAEISKGNESDH